MQGYNIENIKMVNEVPGSTDLKPGTLGSKGLKKIYAKIFWSPRLYSCYNLALGEYGLKFFYSFMV